MTSKAAPKKTETKAPAKKASAKKTAAKAEKPKAEKKAKAPPKGKKSDAKSEVDAAVQEIQEHIEEHEFAGSTVRRSDSVDFFRAIGNFCHERADEIAQEREDQGEGDGFDGVDDSGGEPDTDDLDLDDE